MLMLGIYLLIGLILALYYFKLLGELIEEYERGDDLIEGEEKVLSELNQNIKIFGGKAYVITLSVAFMLLWPVCIFEAFEVYKQTKSK